ncbi:hypothetical protein GCM10009735_17950 [Actinomadura chokoriensis]
MPGGTHHGDSSLVIPAPAPTATGGLVSRWRLRPAQERPGRLRLACYKPMSTDTDRVVEEKGH